MKKMMSLLLAAMMLLTAALACTAAAEEDSFPQPEGGKKFDTHWAQDGALVQIDYEEEGYRVFIRMFNETEGKGATWEYSCYYSEEKDELQSVSSQKRGFTIDPEMMEEIPGEEAYEGLDEEGMTTTFKVNADGLLVWNDAHENAGEGKAFANIGRFDGRWGNEAEEVRAWIGWDGIDPETPFYTVYIRRGTDARFTLFTMRGTFNPETGKLECQGTAMDFALQDGEYVTNEDNETYDAFFSMTENGRLLYEAANGIELEYVGHFEDND